MASTMDISRGQQDKTSLGGSIMQKKILITEDNRFVCRVCYRTYLGSRSLNKHMTSHTEEEIRIVCEESLGDHAKNQQIKDGTHKPVIVIPCDLCNRTYLSTSSLRRHQQKVHKIDLTYISDDKRVYTKTDIMTFSCRFCKNKYDSIKSLRRHEQVHGCEYMVGYEKQISIESEEVFQTQEENSSDQINAGSLGVSSSEGQGGEGISESHASKELEMDTSGGHLREDQEVASTGGHTSMQEENEPSEFLCALCGTSLLSKDALTQHVMDKHRDKDTAVIVYVCGECNESFFTENEWEDHMKSHELVGGKVYFQCEECGKKFPENQLSKIKTHIQSHTGEKPFECQDCHAKFLRYCHLASHIKGSHSVKANKTPKVHGCGECGRIFSQSSHLKSHIRSHRGDKPYACSLCDKRFLSSSHLKEHFKTHTGERPFKCPHCEKTFQSSSHVKTHIMSHTGERPHGCSQCGKRFLQSSHLKTHILSAHIDIGDRGSDYECIYCSKRFVQSSHLKSHIRTHTGEKPYECRYCGKKYTHHSHLKVHLKAHEVQGANAGLQTIIRGGNSLEVLSSVVHSHSGSIGTVVPMSEESSTLVPVAIQVLSVESIVPESSSQVEISSTDLTELAQEHQPLDDPEPSIAEDQTPCAAIMVKAEPVTEQETPSGSDIFPGVPIYRYRNSDTQTDSSSCILLIPDSNGQLDSARIHIVPESDLHQNSAFLISQNVPDSRIEFDEMPSPGGIQTLIIEEPTTVEECTTRTISNVVSSIQLGPSSVTVTEPSLKSEPSPTVTMVEK